MATCPPLDKLVGLRIEDLELVRLLGEGGMGVTYEGRQHSLGRDVCVKFLRGELVGDRLAYERFTREAIALSNLRDKNVVSVYSFGLYDGTYPYIVMELCRGESLRQALATGGNGDWKRSCTMFLEICDAVGRVHSAGIIHRDLKPDNIFIAEPQNTVKVIDFGLAASDCSAHSDTLTRTGAIIGSPHYMAPECFTGRTRTALIDVYALGIILYEMLTGHPPLADTFMPALAYKRLTEALPPLPVSVASADERGLLEAFISKSCAVSPADRFQSCKEMADCLRLIVDAQPHHETLKIMLGTPKRRRALLPKRAASLVAILALLVSITALVCLGPGTTDSSMFPKARNIRNACVSILSDIPQHKLSQFSNLSYPELKEAQEKGSVPEAARPGVQKSLADYRLRVKTNTVELTNQICAKQSIPRSDAELLRKCAGTALLAGAKEEAVLLLLAAAERAEDSAQFRVESADFVLTHLMSLSNVGIEVPRVRKLIDSLDRNNKARLHATLVSLVLSKDKLSGQLVLPEFVARAASASLPELEVCRPKMDEIIALCIARGEKKGARELLTAVINVDIANLRYGMVGCDYQLLSELSGETDRKETDYLHNSLKYFEKDNFKNPAAFATLVKLANYSRTPSEARGYLARASTLLPACKDSSIKCDYWGVSANVFSTTGEHHKAREYALLQLESLRHYSGDRDGAGYRVWLVRCTKVRHNLAWILQRAGDFELAVKVLTEAEREATANGLVDYELANVKLSRSELFQQRGQFTEALSCLNTSLYSSVLQSLPAQQSEELKFELGRRRVDILLREAGRCYRLKSAAQAQRLIQESSSVFKFLDESVKGTGLREKIVDLKSGVARGADDMGESVVAISLNEQILDQSKRAGNEKRVANVAIILSRLYEKRKEWSKSVAILMSCKRWFLVNSDLESLNRLFDLCERAGDQKSYDELRSDVIALVDSRRLGGTPTLVWGLVERLGDSLKGSYRDLRLYGAALELPSKPSFVVCERIARWGVTYDESSLEWRRLLDKVAAKMNEASDADQAALTKIMAVAFRCAGNIAASERYAKDLERLANRQWNSKPAVLAQVTLAHYAELLANMGRQAEAVKYIRRACELTLQSGDCQAYNYFEAYNLFASARYAESIAVMNRALSRDHSEASSSLRRDARDLVALNEYYLGHFNKADRIWSANDKVAPTSLLDGDRTRLHVFAIMGDKRRYKDISKRWTISPVKSTADGAWFKRLHLELASAEFLLAGGAVEDADKVYQKWFHVWDDCLDRARKGEQVGYMAHGLHRLALSGQGLVDLELGRVSHADEYFTRALDSKWRGDCPNILTNYVLVGKIHCALKQKQSGTALKFLRLLEERASTISPISRRTMQAHLVQCEKLAAQCDTDSKNIGVTLERMIKDLRALPQP